MAAREPGQVRKEAALSGSRHVMQASLARANRGWTRPEASSRRRVHGPFFLPVRSADSSSAIVALRCAGRRTGSCAACRVADADLRRLRAARPRNQPRLEHVHAPRAPASTDELGNCTGPSMPVTPSVTHDGRLRARRTTAPSLMIGTNLTFGELHDHGPVHPIGLRASQRSAARGRRQTRSSHRPRARILPQAATAPVVDHDPSAGSRSRRRSARSRRSARRGRQEVQEEAER